MEKYNFTEAIESIEQFWRNHFNDSTNEISIVKQAFYGGQKTAYNMIINHLKNKHDTEKK